MFDTTSDKIIFVLFTIIIIIYTIATNKYNEKEYNKDEQIKQLEQSLTEQIQEVEVYRNILEEYQTEGIINE